MQTGNHNHENNNDDPTWHFIAEFSLDEVTFDEFMATELTAGSLFQAMRDRGIPPECIERIKGTIVETVRGARGSFYHSLPGLPVRVCLFSNKRKTDKGHRSGDQMNGGWGYYLIERGKDFLNVPWQECPRVVELYLYKEGE